jgi:hypothetical protein
MKRLSLLSFALALPLASVACGSDDEGEGGGPVEGENYQYVVSTIDTRSTNKLDIDGNGTPDNKLGGLVDLLVGAGIGVQETIDDAIATGSATLLADLQTTSFTSSGAAGFSVYLADSATISPAPCTDPLVIETCGKHLAGTGMFSIAASSPRDTQLAGKFVNSKMEAGPGKLAIQIALTGAPITVNLVGARAQISSVTADGIGKGLLGGAVTEAELNNNLFPTVHTQLTTVVDRDCGPEATRVKGTGGACGQMVGGTFMGCVSTGASLLTFFDVAVAPATTDCKITLDEVKNNVILGPSLRPDVTIDGVKAVSVVLGFTAKKATFTVN